MKSFELKPYYGHEKELSICVDTSFQFTVTGNTALVKLPPPSKSPAKKDGLYNTTCFEIFIANSSGQYLEWNFSPALDWCLFSFESERKKSSDLLGKESFSQFHFDVNPQSLNLKVQLDSARIRKVLNSPGKLKASMTAVIEFQSGKKDYYAFKHLKDKPDFHDLNGFLIDW